jgi:hypothetical protein
MLIWGCGDIDLSFPSTLLWHLPTPAEFAIHPITTDFVFVGANVPQGGVDPIGGAFNKFGVTSGELAVAAPYICNLWHNANYHNGAFKGDLSRKIREV